MVLINRNNRVAVDGIVKGRNFCIVLSWILFFLIILIFGWAWPRQETMFDRIYETTGQIGIWDIKLIIYAFYLLIPLAIISITGIVLNSMRHKRKYDRYSLSLIISFLISVLGIILFGVYFF